MFGINLSKKGLPFQYAEDNDYVEVGLWVLDGNNQAIRFYEKNGFLSNGDTISCTIGEKHTNEKRYIKKLI